MDDGSLILEQEEAYRRLNVELELRTKRLMKQVEDAIHKDSPLFWDSDASTISTTKFQEDHHRVESNNHHARGVCESNFSSDSESGLDYVGGGGRWGGPGSPAIKEILSPPIRRSVPPHHRVGPARKATPKTSLRSVESLDDLDDVLPAAAKGIGSEGIIRFLKAKVNMLQDELATTQTDYAKKVEEVKRLQFGVKQAEEDKGKAVQEATHLREKGKKTAAQVASISDKLTLRDNENSILKKEIEMLRQDLKKLNTLSNGNEVKLNNAKDEIERLKHELKKSQIKEKETRDQSKVKVENLVASVRKLEKQKTQLNSAFKKQVALVDNLKKQKNCLEAGKAIRFTEEEFLKLLDWAPGAAGLMEPKEERGREGLGEEGLGEGDAPPPAS